MVLAHPYLYVRWYVELSELTVYILYQFFIANNQHLLPTLGDKTLLLGKIVQQNWMILVALNCNNHPDLDDIYFGI